MSGTEERQLVIGISLLTPGAQQKKITYDLVHHSFIAHFICTLIFLSGSGPDEQRHNVLLRMRVFG